MKAAVLHEFGRPLKIDEVQTPQIGPKGVLLKVQACGICHTDLSTLDGIRKPDLPMILGHEIAGKVSEVGEDVQEFKRGDRVAVYHTLSCGKCIYCKIGKENLCRHRKTIYGGFAEYLKAPDINLVKLPPEISFEEGAILTCAGITSYHALRDVADLRVGETVAIYGIGGLGMHAVQIARIIGARIIAIDIKMDKLNIAKKLGADSVIDASEEDPVRTLKELTNSEGVDVAVQLTPDPRLIEQALKSVRRGGRVVAVGWGMRDWTLKGDMIEFLRSEELKLMGCRGSGKQNLLDLVKLIETRRINENILISHRIPLNEVNFGMEILRKGIAMKVVVMP